VPYTPFDPAKPDAATQNGTQFAQAARDNLKAARDACILGGGFPGFNLAVSGGTASQPALLTYSKGTERVKAALTWGTTGGENGNVTVAVYSYSSNSGGAYDTIGTKTITYDTNSNVTATTWA
jgi:hypothetical protein